jgi:hypothetical protein
MQGGKRKLTQWNMFVKKVFSQGRSKNKNYTFKQALSDASKRKGEMGTMGKKTKSKSCQSKRTRKNR